MNNFIKSLFFLLSCAFLLVGCSVDLEELGSAINSAVDVEGIGEAVGSAVEAVKPVTLSGAITETVLAPGFNAAEELSVEKISFTNSEAKIRIIPSDETRVEILHPSDLADYGFFARIEDGEIEIGVPKQTNFIAEKFEITVYGNISDIEISGSVDLEIDGSGINEYDIDILGAAKVYMYKVAAKEFSLEVNGAGAINISGTADYFEAEINGAGTLDAKSLLCRIAEIEISGAGTAGISVTDELLADLDGVGSLEYYGDPVLRNISGGLTDVEQISKEVYGG